MNAIFYIAAAVAIVSTLMVVTRVAAVHALLYLIVSLLSVALIFFVMGAPFIAALETIIYAGAIMVLFVFVVMMLNLGPKAERSQKPLLSPRAWIGPTILALILASELAAILARGGRVPGGGQVVDPQQVGLSLFGPYALGVELASMLLLAGVVGALHLGRRPDPYEVARKEEP